MSVLGPLQTQNNLAEIAANGSAAQAAALANLGGLSVTAWATPGAIGSITPNSATFTGGVVQGNWAVGALFVRNGAGQAILATTTNDLTIFTGATAQYSWTFTNAGLLTIPVGGGILGEQDASNAPSGCVGEYLTATGTTTAGTGATVNPCAVVLTPGDWDVQGTAVITPPTGTTPTDINCGLTTTALTNAPVLQKTEIYAAFQPPPGPPQVISSPRVRFNVSVNTTVYLSSGGAFSGAGPFTIQGQITARRMR